MALETDRLGLRSLKYWVSEEDLEGAIKDNKERLKDKGLTLEESTKIAEITDNLQKVLDNQDLELFNAGKTQGMIVGQEEFSSSVSEHYRKSKQIRNRGEDEVPNYLKLLYRKYKQSKAKQDIVGFTAAGNIVGWLKAGAKFGIQSAFALNKMGSSLVDYAKNSDANLKDVWAKFEQPKFEQPDPKKDLVENLKTLLYQDDEKTVEHGNLDFIIKSMTENPNIRKFVSSDQSANKELQSLFTEALKVRLREAGETERVEIYTKVLEEFNKDGMTLDADNKVKSYYYELDAVSSKGDFQKTVSENKTIFSSPVLTKNIFSDSPLRRPIDENRIFKKDRSGFVQRGLRDTLRTSMPDGTYEKMNRQTVINSMTDKMRKACPGLEIGEDFIHSDGNESNADFETKVELAISNILNLYVVSEQIKVEMERVREFEERTQELETFGNTDELKRGLKFPDLNVSKEFIRVMESRGIGEDDTMLKMARRSVEAQDEFQRGNLKNETSEEKKERLYLEDVERRAKEELAAEKAEKEEADKRSQIGGEDEVSRAQTNVGKILKTPEPITHDKGSSMKNAVISGDQANTPTITKTSGRKNEELVKQKRVPQK